MRFAGAGDQRIGEAPQDVVFIVREKPHPIFKRDGDNLTTTVTLSLKDALCAGVTLILPTIDGKGVKFPLRGVIKPNSTRVLGGYGMPKKGGGHGDLIVTFEVSFPNKLTEAQISGLRNLL